MRDRINLPITPAYIKYYLQNFRAEKTIDLEFEKVKPFSREFLEEIVNKENLKLTKDNLQCIQVFGRP